MAEFDAEGAAEPMGLFREWMRLAAETEVNDPEAVALATATAAGAPSVRIVLLKGLAARGFRFYTNAESQKGRELAENPQAALCFHWKTQRRQVRVEGRVQELPETDADAYFHSRGRRSQVGAVASQQSRPLGSRAELEAAAADVARRYPEGQGEVPRPAYWRGYQLEAVRVEFWQDGADRLHDRVVFVWVGAAWRRARLFP